IPDLAKSEISLSSIFLFDVALKKGAEAAGNDKPVQFIDSGTQTLRYFTKKSSLGFIYYIYNASENSTDELADEISILQGNKAIFTNQPRTIKAQRDKAGRIGSSGSVPLVGLPPGHYTLKIDVKKRGELKASQQVNFLIE